MTRRAYKSQEGADAPNSQEVSEWLGKRRTGWGRRLSRMVRSGKDLTEQSGHRTDRRIGRRVTNDIKRTFNCQEGDVRTGGFYVLKWRRSAMEKCRMVVRVPIIRESG